jgi:hypothetical protein
MNRIALSILAILGAPAFAAAQPAAPQAQIATSPPPRTVRAGARFGLTFASVAGDDVDDAALTSRQGLSVGGFISVRLGPNFAIEPALGYAQKGAAVKADLGGGRLALDYLQAPLVLVGLIPVHPIVDLRAFGGPSVSYLISAEAKQGGQAQDIGDRSNKFDLGAVFGAGVDVTLPSGLLLFDLRYELGLTSIDDSSAEADTKNRVFSMNAGFGF